MTREEAIYIIKAERECVYRQGRTGECCRDDMGCGACDLVQEDTNIMKAYDMAIEALKERPHGEWIPCAERLPEEDDNTQVLVSVNERYASFYKIILMPSRSVKTEYKLGHIDAWMPLPEPYKKEGEAE